MEGMGENPQQTAAPVSGAIAKSLASLRAKAKRRLLITRMGAILGVLVLAAIAAGLADYVLRLPMGLRIVLWLSGLAFVVASVRSRVLPVLRFRPSLTEIALRLEQSPIGRQAGLPGVLASGFELSQTEDAGHASGSSAALRARAAAEAAEKFATLPGAAAALSPAPVRRTLGWLAAAGVPLILLLVLAPSFMRIGVERVLTPWTSAAWPKRTMVLAATPPKAHALGTVYPLRAVLARAAAPRGQSDVKVHYRVIVDGQSGPTRDSLLTSQNRDATVAQGGSGAPATGELYERLLDLSSVAPAGMSPDRRVQLEYWFESRDDQTDPERVLLVEAPSLVNASATVTPPGYALQALASGTDLATGTLDLGAGRDDRAAIGPVLAGSSITLDLKLNKPLPTPADAAALSAFLQRTFTGIGDAPLAAEPTFNATEWKIPLLAPKSLRLALHLTDEYGIAAADETTFKIDVVDDAPPGVVIVEPPSDESVLPTAIFEAAAEGRDDVAIAWTKLFSQVARPPSDSVGAPADPVGQPEERVNATPGGEGHAALTKVRAGDTIDIAALTLKPGDELWLSGAAADVFAASGGREPVTSAKRRIRIISDSEFIEQVRAELSGVRESAKRLAATQDALGEKLPQAQAEPTLAQEQSRAQAGVQERIAPMRDTIKRLQSRVDRNRLGDAGIEGVLADSKTILEAAASHSDEAQKALDTLGDPNAPAPAREQAGANAKREQQGAQEELTNLANLLDRGQDTWAVKRALEKLLIEQKQLASQTKAAQGESDGAKPESLSPAQRAELADLAKRQRDAARRADAIIDALTSRAQAVSQADKAQAEAMKNAAKVARQQELSQNQSKAAQKIDQNQTSQASKLQDQAAKTIEDLLNELDKGDQKRDEQLKRDLADIRESIERLIASQQTELDALGNTVAHGGDVKADKLDSKMLVLNQNTLSVAADARDKVKGGEKLISFLSSASDAQGAAIIALRAAPADTPEADGSERTSLSRLRAALAEAERLEKEADDRDSARQRAELRKAYIEALELQAAIQGDAVPLLGRELTRREKIASRGLGEREQALRATLSELRSKTQELEDAKVFAFAHRRLDEAMARAGDTLGQGAPTDGTKRDLATSVRMLQSLVLALSQDKPKDEFREDDGGGGGGGSGPGGKPPLIPPLAELKLLRAMQAEAGELTRSAETTPDDLKAAADLQGQITQEAQALLERLKGPPEEAPGAKEAPDDAPQDSKPDANKGDGGAVQGGGGGTPDEPNAPKEPTP
ncbi:MAG: hypothetical protein WC718_09395 [Phycisphaerales bacterium]|jgi:hypothetical protein